MNNVPRIIKLVSNRVPNDITLGNKSPFALENGQLFFTGIEDCEDIGIEINVKDAGAGTGTLVLYIQDSWDKGENWQDLIASNSITVGTTVGLQRFILQRRTRGESTTGTTVTNLTQGGVPTSYALAAGSAHSRPWGDRLRVVERYTSGGSGGQPTYDIWLVLGYYDNAR
jgi:hypothetical protein